MEPVFRHEPEWEQFVAEVDGHRATLSYRRVAAGVLDFESTFVPTALRHRRVGTALVRHALDWARAEGERVVPSCWFVKVIAEQVPAYRALLTRPDG